MTCRRGRPRGLTQNRTANRYIIAGALIAGITVAAVARQLGVSGSWASREANASGTRLVIAELFEANRERINAMLDRTLDVIEAAFEARCTLVVKGTLVDGGPDHYARIEAGHLVVRLLRQAR
jgi:hypothetical protein